MANAWTSRWAAAPLVRATTRRRVLGLLGGLAAIGVRAPGVSAQEATSAAGGQWSFTDDAGKTVTLPERPTRIVADLNAASALWDFGVRPIAVSGWAVGTDAAWGNVDRATPDITASTEAPNPDLEALIGLDPDLFVTIVWGDEEAPYSWSFPEAETYARAERITPVIGISAAGRADENMLRFAELASALGADLDSPELTAAKAAYEEQAAAFSELARQKADLASLFSSADNDGIVIANPTAWADLAMFKGLGLNMVHPEIDPKSYWEKLSAELAMKYPADIVFLSTVLGASSPEQLAAHPTFGRMPAVKAGQTALWNQDFIQSFQGLTAALETVTAALREAQVVTP